MLTRFLIELGRESVVIRGIFRPTLSALSIGNLTTRG